VSAVPCEVDVASGVIDRAGIPLGISSVPAPSAIVRVERTTATDNSLLGVSAGREVVVDGKRVVPVATAGVVKVVVEHSGSVQPGAPLTASSTDGSLTPVSMSERVVARAAQEFTGAPGSTDIFAWIVYPSSS
jgi:hypothetical protein